MRTGQILSFNKKAGIGLIRDTNDEHIKFYIEDSKLHPVRGDNISFEIGFRGGALIAKKLKLLTTS